MTQDRVCFMQIQRQGEQERKCRISWKCVVCVSPVGNQSCQLSSDKLSHYTFHASLPADTKMQRPPLCVRLSQCWFVWRSLSSPSGVRPVWHLDPGYLKQAEAGRLSSESGLRDADWRLLAVYVGRRLGVALCLRLSASGWSLLSEFYTPVCMFILQTDWWNQYESHWGSLCVSVCVKVWDQIPVACLFALGCRVPATPSHSIVSFIFYTVGQNWWHQTSDITHMELCSQWKSVDKAEDVWNVRFFHCDGSCAYSWLNHPNEVVPSTVYQEGASLCCEFIHFTSKTPQTISGLSHVMMQQCNHHSSSNSPYRV